MLLLGILAGCATQREHLDQALLAERSTPPIDGRVVEQYDVRSPDVLEVVLRGDVNRTYLCPVALDGRIDLGPVGKLRVEGQTVPEIAKDLSVMARQPPDAIQVRVAEYKSQHVYLAGEGNNLQRAVAYQGPETVLDLLQRAGGIKPGAAPREVYVIRTGVAEGRPPQYFRIDLPAVVLKQDHGTNLRLQPFDEIYIGESKKSSLQKCFPEWLQPLYRSICGFYRP